MSRMSSMSRMIGIFLNFISENYLTFLMIGILLIILLYVGIGDGSGLFWSFVFEAILSFLIILIVSFVLVYLAIGF